MLAAAIRGGAQTIVTFNLKDFPSNALASYGIEAQHPDDFLFDLLDLDLEAVKRAVQAQVGALRNPPATMPEHLDTLHAQGLEQVAARLRSLLTD